MPIIILSSDSYERGRQVAEKTAEALGYRYVDREILGPAAERHVTAESKLRKALDELPSLLGISSKEQPLCLAYIEEATLSLLTGDNVVCHGLAAHLYVLGVSHVLRVRILAESQEIIRNMAPHDGLSSEKAARLLKRRESSLRRWSVASYGQDETNPSLYDLVINLSQIEPEEAVKTIVDTVAYPKFRAMTYSLKCMRDKELAARVRARLIGNFPDVRVRAEGPTVAVETKGLRREKRKREETIKNFAGEIEGVENVEVHVINDIFRQAAESFR